MTNQIEKQNCASLPYSVYSADWLRNAEANAARDTGLTLFTLMQRAAAAAFRLARSKFPHATRWLVLCGKGNNGGDGYEVARLAKLAGLDVTLLAVNGDKPLPAEAEQARAGWIAVGGKAGDIASPWPAGCELIIDALLGTGLSSAPRAPIANYIEVINQYSAPVVALDVPSGLAAETGTAAGEVVQATLTVTFIAMKPGLLTGQARDYVGELCCDALGLQSWLSGHLPLLQRIDEGRLAEWLHPRRPCSHKGEHGHLLVVGGDSGYAGAIRMAAEAALRTGAGMVRVLTHKQHIGPLLTARPELMVQELSEESVKAGLEWASAVVIGPGLGQNDWGKSAFTLIAASDKPALWDADALNMLAKAPDKRQNRVLTPHPGEAARLLDCSVKDIESDRLLSLRRLVQRYGGVVVLKGAGTLVGSQDGQIAIADVGNAGMATGGMGDILSGIIGGLLAQKLSFYDAACAGTVVHGTAADIIAQRQGTRGMLATDLLTWIAPTVNPDFKNRNHP